LEPFDNPESESRQLLRQIVISRFHGRVMWLVTRSDWMACGAGRRLASLAAAIFTAVACTTSVRLAAQDHLSRHREGLRTNAPDRFALINARIVVSPGRSLEKGMIVVNGRQIVSVSESIAPPPDCLVIDCAGRTIYSGLIDSFTEFEVDAERAVDGSRYWNSRIRPEVDLAQEPLVESEVQVKFRQQGIACRLVAPSRGVLKGQSCLLLSLDGEIDECLLKERVAQHGSLTIPISREDRDQYPSSPMGATALLRQAFYDARWYGQAWRAARNGSVAPPENNVSLEALLPVLESQQPIVADCSNEAFALRADRLAREFGFPLILRGSGREYERLEQIARTGRPILLPIDFPKPPNVGTREGALNASLESLMHWDLAPENPARLAGAGVRFAFCSYPSKDVAEFLPHVRRAVHRGLSRERALAALTTEPAAIFGVESLLGTIEKNKLANLVVADGDLFDAKTQVVETWIAGQRFELGPSDFARIEDTWELTIPTLAVVQSLKLVVEAADDTLEARIETEQEPKPETDSDPPKGEADAVSPEPRADEPNSTVRSFAVQGNRLSGSIDGLHLGRDGWVQLTLVVVGDAASGHVVFADGTAAQATARRVGRSPDEKIAADGLPENRDEKSNVLGGEAKPKQDKGDQSGYDPDKDLPASYPVNYPLGAYGVVDLPDEPALIAFRNATIWTCGPQGVVAGGTLVVSRGKIVTVLTERQALPQGARVVDASGLHITPGIIDCHSHMATDGGVNEGGQAITAEVRIGDFVDAHDITIYRQLAGGVTAANVLHGSANPIGGQNQVIKLRWGAGDEELKFAEAPPGIKFALGENVKRSNRPEDDESRYPKTRMGVEQIIDDAFRAARDYRRKQDEFRRTNAGLPPRMDLELEALAEVVEGQRWIHCHSYRQDEILALIRLLDAHGIRIGSFQHILEGYKVADKMAEHGATASAFADWWAYKFEVYDAIPYAGALMHQAGLVVSFNSDDAELGRHLNHEAAKAVRYGGVEPAEALKFVTLNPAKQLRIDPFVGSLEPNKHADFVLWNGPPLSNFARPEQTWIDGRKYFDRVEDESRRRENEERHQALVQKALASGQDPASGDDPTGESRLWPRYDEFCHGHDHEHE
jgi:N-acetylglucosamine-6-phosphate deacetylase